MKIVLRKEEVSGFAIGNNQSSGPCVLEGIPSHSTFQKILMLHYIYGTGKKNKGGLPLSKRINHFECRVACNSSRGLHVKRIPLLSSSLVAVAQMNSLLSYTVGL
jgi:hypothetical protein